MTTPKAYVEDQFTDDPPLGQEKGSSFSWEQPFGGWENGKVFTYPEPTFRDYNEMLETDGKAATTEQLLAYPIISAPWDIEPAKDDSGQAEFILDCLTDLPHQGGPRTTVEELISQMTTAMTHRRTYFEKSFKVNDDDRVVYDKIAWRPYETCQLMLDDQTGDMLGFRQTPVRFDGQPWKNANGNGYIDFPMKSSFIYTHGTWRDPILGFSSMKVPYWAYITKRKLRWLWYQFLDNGFLPKTIVKNEDETEAIATAKKVAQLRGKGVLGVSGNNEFEYLKSEPGISDGYLTAIRFLDSEMSNSVMAGFMDLTDSATDSKGSYALAESSSKFFLRNRRMVAHDMARQITNNVIGDLIRYNFGRQAPVPRFKFGALSEQNESLVLDMFKSVSTTGANVDPEFYDQLQTRVAQLLELDAGKVRASMRSLAETPGELNQVASQVDVATSMVSQAQTAGAIPPSKVGPAPGTPGVPSAAPPSRKGKDSVAHGRYGGSGGTGGTGVR